MPTSCCWLEAAICVAACDDSEKPSGCYARWVGGERPVLLLLGLPNREPITRDVFEDVMCGFAEDPDGGPEPVRRSTL